MKRVVVSRYIRVTKNNDLLKRWIAKLILAIDLEEYLVFERIERRVLCGFRTANLTKENQEDAEFIRAWNRRLTMHWLAPVSAALV